jgi:iron complex outermembrane receptor protein
MKTIILLILPLLTFTFSYGQQEKTQITGNLIDHLNSPLDQATLILKNAKDSKVVKIEFSEKSGTFKFEKISHGTYFIEASLSGYQTNISKSFSITETTPALVLDNIILKIESIALSEVTIVSKKLLIQQKTDRIIINLDASITNVGSSALEILEKSPGVSINKDGIISLKGKPGVLVMIDGKTSYLSSSDLANLLGSMSSNELSQIEIMSNPSAKYDAAGNAGIINIKTKKGATKGFNGSFTSSIGQGKYSKLNTALMLNFRTDKMNIFLNLGLNYTKNFMFFDAQRNFFNIDGTKSYELNQKSNRIREAQNQSLKMGLDYYLNTQTSIGFMTSGFVNPQTEAGLTNTVLENANGLPFSYEKTQTDVNNSWKNGTFNVNFLHESKTNKNNITANLDYLHYDFSGDQDISRSTYDSNKIFQTKSLQKNSVPLKIDIYSARIDYAKELENGINIETGLKTSTVRSVNASNFFNVLNSSFIPDKALTNAFKYSENINALYLNLNKKIKDWEFQGGLRIENTNYKGAQSSLSQVMISGFSKSKISLFPSALTSYKLNEKNRVSLSAGRRIDRPEYQQLNPFIGIMDRYTFATGNPYLQPQFSTNIELSHNYNNKFTSTLNYSIIKNMINETLTQNDSLIVRSFGNIGTRYNYGISESMNLNYKNWYSATIFANLYYNKYIGMINGYPLKANQMTISLNMNNQFSFSNGWTAELSGFYLGKNRNEGQAVALPSGQLSTGISKKLLNDKASLKLSFKDIFYTQNPKEIQNFQQIQSTLIRNMDTRVVTLAFVYRFGNSTKPKPSKTEPTEEQERVKTF